MAGENVKTVLRLPSGVNKSDFIRNLIWQHQQQQHKKNGMATNNNNNNNKISSNSHQKMFRNIHRKRSALKSFF